MPMTESEKCCRTDVNRQNETSLLQMGSQIIQDALSSDSQTFLRERVEQESGE